MGTRSPRQKPYVHNSPIFHRKLMANPEELTDWVHAIDRHGPDFLSMWDRHDEILASLQREIKCFGSLASGIGYDRPWHDDTIFVSEFVDWYTQLRKSGDQQRLDDYNRKARIKQAARTLRLTGHKVKHRKPT